MHIITKMVFYLEEESKLLLKDAKYLIYENIYNIYISINIRTSHTMYPSHIIYGFYILSATIILNVALFYARVVSLRRRMYSNHQTSRGDVVARGNILVAVPHHYVYSFNWTQKLFQWPIHFFEASSDSSFGSLSCSTDI